jgi:hypothetical protein
MRETETLTVPLAHSTSSQHRSSCSPNILRHLQVPEVMLDSAIADRTPNKGADFLENNQKFGGDTRVGER